MTDYLALLKQRVPEKHRPASPSKPSKATFEPFEADRGRSFSRTDARIPDEWIAGLNRLRAVEPLPALASRWPQIVADLATFLPAWGQQSMALGWTAADIIGVHPRAPDSRWDVAGLLLVTAGRQVVMLTADTATIGASLATFRKPQPGGVPLWRLIEGPPK
jgi:hypothetical protein